MITLRSVGVSAALSFLTLGCTGPIPLSVAIDPVDQDAYLAELNAVNMDGKAAFAAWMASERGVSPERILQEDLELSDTRNPFDAYTDYRAVSRGAVIFTMHCARCHGFDARGTGPSTLPQFPADDFRSFFKRVMSAVHRGTPRKWFREIRDGKGQVIDYAEGPSTAMPPFADKLAREQIWWVITYLQSLDVHTPRKPAPDRS